MGTYYDKIELTRDGAQWWASFSYHGLIVFESWFGNANEAPGRHLDSLIEENGLVLKQWVGNG